MNPTSNKGNAARVDGLAQTELEGGLHRNRCERDRQLESCRPAKHEQNSERPAQGWSRHESERR